MLIPPMILKWRKRFKNSKEMKSKKIPAKSLEQLMNQSKKKKVQTLSIIERQKLMLTRMKS